MTRRTIPTRFSAGAGTLRAVVATPRPKQKMVNRALCGYFDAARVGDSALMLRSVAVVASASEQQVQFAMQFVQRLRRVSRGDLLAVLIGDETRSPKESIEHATPANVVYRSGRD